MLLPWNEVESLEDFRAPRWTTRIREALSCYDPKTKAFDARRRDAMLELLQRHTPTVLARVKKLETELNKRFVAKEEIIRMVIVGSISQQPLLLIGEPGTAKSKIISRFCEGLGMQRVGAEQTEESYFQYQLHGFTEPDEILGVVDLRGLQQEAPAFRRLPAGSITEAEVIFLDEVFRSNSAILNSLLSIINERRVYEGGVIRKAKGRLIFGASNTVPTGRQLDELQAFYARFVIRLHSQPLPRGPEANRMPAPPPAATRPPGTPSPGRPAAPAPPPASPPPSSKELDARLALLKLGWADEVEDLRAGYDPQETAAAPVSCLNDLLWLNRAMTESWGGPDLEDPQIKSFVTLYRGAVVSLMGQSPPLCRVDDRKFIRLFSVLRAHALFAHEGPPNKTDLRILRHTWDDPASLGTLTRQVETYIERPS
jgi:hypothetical protein